MSAVEELAKICAELPAQKIEELVDFARFLRARAAELPGDAAWERVIASEGPRPKLDAFVSAALAAGTPTPLEGNL